MNGSNSTGNLPPAAPPPTPAYDALTALDNVDTLMTQNVAQILLATLCLFLLSVLILM